MDNVNSGKDRSQEPAFRDARRGKPWFGPVYFRKETEPYMTIAIRSGGDAGPVTVADVNLKFIWDVVSRIKIGDKGKAYVVDRNGFLIADPDIGLVLRKTDLSNLPHVKAAHGVQDPGAAAILSKDLTGTEVLTSVATIEPLAWSVFVEQPVTEVYAKLYSSVFRTGLLLLVGLVISALGALALARGMVRPIRILDEGARRIGDGDLDQKIDIHTGDELEALADQFNRMTGQLSESYAGLERKVEERTRRTDQSSLEQQTAISEILRVISASPTDMQPVLDAVAERAAEAMRRRSQTVIALVEGENLRSVAEGFRKPFRPLVGDVLPVPLADVVAGRAIDRQDDDSPGGHRTASLEAEYPVGREMQRRLGHHTRPGGAADARGAAIRCDRALADGSPTVLVEAGRAGPDVRPPGGDRHRQRPAVQRDQGRAGTADGDQRNPARDLELPDRRQAGAGHDRGPRGQPVRRRRGVHSPDRRKRPEACRVAAARRRRKPPRPRCCRSSANRFPAGPCSSTRPFTSTTCCPRHPNIRSARRFRAGSAIARCW